MKIYNIRYYLPISSNKTSARQNKELRALDTNRPQYHKYQREYKVHCWMPPITVLPPDDNSIRNDY
jgi:hypothetical protein